MAFRKHRWMTAVVAVVLGLGGLAWPGYAYLSLPGVIPPSGCGVGAVLSTDQFTTTGFSNVRTVGPGDEAPAGAWVLVDDFVPSTSVIGATNCPIGAPPDGWPLFVVGLRLTPTIGSWQEADIQELKLVQDLNLDGLYDEGLDPVLQVRSGQELKSSRSVTFFNGPQAPIFIVPSGGAVGILVVVKIGPNPQSGSQFGLMLEAAAADVPTLGIISSSFSSSRNPQGSSIRLHLIGGGAGSPPPPQVGGVKQFDTNGNCVIDDGEFFKAIDSWVQGQISNALFFQVVDAWIAQRNVCVSGSALEGDQQGGVTLRASRSGVVFAARGQGVASLGVRIYDLAGREVFAREVAGTTLRWNYLNSEGGLVASGVYLYTAIVRDINGRLMKSTVQKLIVSSSMRKARRSSR